MNSRRFVMRYSFSRADARVWPALSSWAVGLEGWLARAGWLKPQAGTLGFFGESDEKGQGGKMILGSSWVAQMDGGFCVLYDGKQQFGSHVRGIRRGVRYCWTAWVLCSFLSLQW